MNVRSIIVYLVSLPFFLMLNLKQKFQRENDLQHLTIETVFNLEKLNELALKNLDLNYVQLKKLEIYLY